MDPQQWQIVHREFGGQCKQGDIAPYVLVPGSKARTRRFASLWDDARLMADHHEFLIYSGTYEGIPLSVCSTGIGGTSVSVAIEELISLGGHTFIRVGVTGSLQRDIPVGMLTIASAAVRRDRTSCGFIPMAIPALASPEVTLALRSACIEKEFKFRIGITATSGTFYCGEGRPGYNGYSQKWMEAIVSDFQQAGIIDWDTETAALYAICLARGVRAGRINGVVDSVLGEAPDPSAEERAVEAALLGVSKLAAWDQENKPESLSLSNPLKGEGMS